MDNNNASQGYTKIVGLNGDTGGNDRESKLLRDAAKYAAGVASQTSTMNTNGILQSSPYQTSGRPYRDSEDTPYHGKGLDHLAVEQWDKIMEKDENVWVKTWNGFHDNVRAGFIGAIGAFDLQDFYDVVVNGGKGADGNFFTRLANEIREQSAKENHIFGAHGVAKQIQNVGTTVGVMLESAAEIGIASALTYVTGGATSAAVVAAMARLGMKLGHISKVLRGVGYTAKFLNNPVSLGIRETLKSTYTNALETKQTVYNKLLENGYKHDAADTIASNAMVDHMKIELAPSVILNTLQFGAMSRVFKGAAGRNPFNIGGASFNTAFNALEGAMGKMTSGIKNNFVRGLADVGINAFTEALEEGFETASGKIAQKWAYDKAGVKSPELMAMLTDEEMWESMIGGAFGGALLGGFGKVGGAARDYLNKDAIEKQKEANRKLMEALSNSYRGLEKKLSHIADGDNKEHMRRVLSFQNVVNALRVDYQNQTNDGIDSYISGLNSIVDKVDELSRLRAKESLTNEEQKRHDGLFKEVTSMGFSTPAEARKIAGQLIEDAASIRKQFIKEYNKTDDDFDLALHMLSLRVSKEHLDSYRAKERAFVASRDKEMEALLDGVDVDRDLAFELSDKYMQHLSGYNEALLDLARHRGSNVFGESYERLDDSVDGISYRNKKTGETINADKANKIINEIIIREADSINAMIADGDNKYIGQDENFDRVFEGAVNDFAYTNEGMRDLKSFFEESGLSKDFADDFMAIYDLEYHDNKRMVDEVSEETKRAAEEYEKLSSDKKARREWREAKIKDEVDSLVRRVEAVRDNKNLSDRQKQIEINKILGLRDSLWNKIKNWRKRSKVNDDPEQSVMNPASSQNQQAVEDELDRTQPNRYVNRAIDHQLSTDPDDSHLPPPQGVAQIQGGGGSSDADDPNSFVSLSGQGQAPNAQPQPSPAAQPAQQPSVGTTSTQADSGEGSGVSEAEEAALEAEAKRVFEAYNPQRIEADDVLSAVSEMLGRLRDKFQSQLLVDGIADRMFQLQEIIESSGYNDPDAVNYFQVDRDNPIEIGDDGSVSINLVARYVQTENGKRYLDISEIDDSAEVERITLGPDSSDGVTAVLDAVGGYKDNSTGNVGSQSGEVIDAIVEEVNNQNIGNSAANVISIEELESAITDKFKEHLNSDDVDLDQVSKIAKEVSSMLQRLEILSLDMFDAHVNGNQEYSLVLRSVIGVDGRHGFNARLNDGLIVTLNSLSINTDGILASTEDTNNNMVLIKDSGEIVDLYDTSVANTRLENSILNASSSLEEHQLGDLFSSSDSITSAVTSAILSDSRTQVYFDAIFEHSNNKLIENYSMTEDGIRAMNFVDYFIKVMSTVQVENPLSSEDMFIAYAIHLINKEKAAYSRGEKPLTNLSVFLDGDGNIDRDTIESINRIYMSIYMPTMDEALKGLADVLIDAGGTMNNKSVIRSGAAIKASGRTSLQGTRQTRVRPKKYFYRFENNQFVQMRHTNGMGPLEDRGVLPGVFSENKVVRVVTVDLSNPDLDAYKNMPESTRKFFDDIRNGIDSQGGNRKFLIPNGDSFVESNNTLNEVYSALMSGNTSALDPAVESVLDGFKPMYVVDENSQFVSWVANSQTVAYTTQRDVASGFGTFLSNRRAMQQNGYATVSSVSSNASSLVANDRTDTRLIELDTKDQRNSLHIKYGYVQAVTNDELKVSLPGGVVVSQSTTDGVFGSNLRVGAGTPVMEVYNPANPSKPLYLPIIRIPYHGFNQLNNPIAHQMTLEVMSFFRDIQNPNIKNPVAFLNSRLHSLGLYGFYTNEGKPLFRYENGVLTYNGTEIPNSDFSSIRSSIHNVILSHKQLAINGVSITGSTDRDSITIVENNQVKVIQSTDKRYKEYLQRFRSSVMSSQYSIKHFTDQDGNTRFVVHLNTNIVLKPVSVANNGQSPSGGTTAPSGDDEAVRRQAEAKKRQDRINAINETINGLSDNKKFHDSQEWSSGTRLAGKDGKSIIKIDRIDGDTVYYTKETYDAEDTGLSASKADILEMIAGTPTTNATVEIRKGNTIVIDGVERKITVVSKADGSFKVLGIKEYYVLDENGNPIKKDSSSPSAGDTRTDAEIIDSILKLIEDNIDSPLMDNIDTLIDESPENGYSLHEFVSKMIPEGNSFFGLKKSEQEAVVELALNKNQELRSKVGEKLESVNKGIAAKADEIKDKHERELIDRTVSASNRAVRSTFGEYAVFTLMKRFVADESKSYDSLPIYLRNRLHSWVAQNINILYSDKKKNLKSEVLKVFRAEVSERIEALEGIKSNLESLKGMSAYTNDNATRASVDKQVEEITKAIETLDLMISDSSSFIHDGMFEGGLKAVSNQTDNKIDIESLGVSDDSDEGIDITDDGSEISQMDDVKSDPTHRSASAMARKFLSGVKKITFVDDNTAVPSRGILGLSEYYEFGEVYESILATLSNGTKIESSWESVKARLYQAINNNMSLAYLAKLIEDIENPGEDSPYKGISGQVKNALQYSLAQGYVRYISAHQGDNGLKVIESNPGLSVGNVMSMLSNTLLDASKRRSIKEAIEHSGMVNDNGRVSINIVLSSVSSAIRDMASLFSEDSDEAVFDSFAHKESQMEKLNSLSNILKELGFNISADDIYSSINNAEDLRAINKFIDAVYKAVSSDTPSGSNIKLGSHRYAIDTLIRIGSSMYTRSFKQEGKVLTSHTQTRHTDEAISDAIHNETRRKELSESGYSRNNLIMLAENSIGSGDINREMFIDRVGMEAVTPDAMTGSDDRFVKMLESDRMAFERATYKRKNSEFGISVSKYTSNNESLRLNYRTMNGPTMSDKGQTFFFTMPLLDMSAPWFNNVSTEDKTITSTAKALVKANKHLSRFLWDMLVVPELYRIVTSGAYKRGHTSNKLDGLFLLIPSLNLIRDSEGKYLLESLSKMDSENVEGLYERFGTSAAEIILSKAMSEQTTFGSYNDSLSNTTNSDGLLSLDLSDSTATDNNDVSNVEALEFALNGYLLAAELHKLVIGDAVHYSSLKKDIPKSMKDSKTGRVKKPSQIMKSYKGRFDEASNAYETAILDGTGTNLGKRLNIMTAQGNKLAGSNDSDPRLSRYIQINLKDTNTVSSNLSMVLEALYPGEVDGKAELLELIERHKDAVKSNSKETSSILAELRKLTGEKFPLIDGYTANAGTDAQEYTTASEHLHILYSQGRLSDVEYKNAVETVKKQSEWLKAYRRISKEAKKENRVRNLNEKDLYNMVLERLQSEGYGTSMPRLSRDIISKVLQPIKPISSGLVYDEKSRSHIPVIVKSSSYPLIPELTMGFELDGLRELMDRLEDEKGLFVRASYSTANKVGAASKELEIWDDNGRFSYSGDDIISEEYYREMDRGIFRVQLDIKAKETGHIAMGTQGFKLLFGDTVMELDGFEFDGKDVSGKELRSTFSSRFKDLLRIKAMMVNEELGLDMNGGIVDAKQTMKAVKDILISEAEKKGLASIDMAFIDAIDLSEVTSVESLYNALSLSPYAKAYESLLMSYLNKRLAAFKLPGYTYVGLSSQGFKFSGMEFSEVQGINPEASRIVFTKFMDSDTLTSTDIQVADQESGEVKDRVLSARVFLPAKFKLRDGKMIEIFKSDGKPNEAYVKWDEKNNRWSLREDVFDDEVLKQVAYRTPTSSFVSMTTIEIAGFLPPEFGDVIVVPDSFTSKMGMDFDVDKLNVYFESIDEVHEIDSDGNGIVVIRPYSDEYDMDAIYNDEEYIDLEKRVISRSYHTHKTSPLKVSSWLPAKADDSNVRDMMGRGWHIGFAKTTVNAYTDPTAISSQVELLGDLDHDQMFIHEDAWYSLDEGVRNRLTLSDDRLIYIVKRDGSGYVVAQHSIDPSTQAPIKTANYILGSIAVVGDDAFISKMADYFASINGVTKPNGFDADRTHVKRVLEGVPNMEYKTYDDHLELVDEYNALAPRSGNNNKFSDMVREKLLGGTTMTANGRFKGFNESFAEAYHALVKSYGSSDSVVSNGMPKPTSKYVRELRALLAVTENPNKTSSNKDMPMAGALAAINTFLGLTEEQKASELNRISSSVDGVSMIDAAYLQDFDVPSEFVAFARPRKMARLRDAEEHAKNQMVRIFKSVLSNPAMMSKIWNQLTIEESRRLRDNMSTSRKSSGFGFGSESFKNYKASTAAIGLDSIGVNANNVATLGLATQMYQNYKDNLDMLPGLMGPHQIAERYLMSMFVEHLEAGLMEGLDKSSPSRGIVVSLAEKNGSRLSAEKKAVVAPYNRGFDDEDVFDSSATPLTQEEKRRIKLIASDVLAANKDTDTTLVEFDRIYIDGKEYDSTLNPIGSGVIEGRSQAQLLDEQLNVSTDNEKEQIQGVIGITMENIAILGQSILSGLGEYKVNLNGAEVNVPIGYLFIGNPLVKAYTDALAIIKKDKTNPDAVHKAEAIKVSIESFMAKMAYDGYQGLEGHVTHDVYAKVTDDEILNPYKDVVASGTRIDINPQHLMDRAATRTAIDIESPDISNAVSGYTTLDGRKIDTAYIIDQTKIDPADIAAMRAFMVFSGINSELINYRRSMNMTTNKLGKSLKDASELIAQNEEMRGDLYSFEESVSMRKSRVDIPNNGTNINLAMFIRDYSFGMELTSLAESSVSIIEKVFAGAGLKNTVERIASGIAQKYYRQGVAQEDVEVYVQDLIMSMAAEQEYPHVTVESFNHTLKTLQMIQAMDASIMPPSILGSELLSIIRIGRDENSDYYAESNLLSMDNDRTLRLIDEFNLLMLSGDSIPGTGITVGQLFRNLGEYIRVTQPNSKYTGLVKILPMEFTRDALRGLGQTLYNISEMSKDSSRLALLEASIEMRMHADGKLDMNRFSNLEFQMRQAERNKPDNRKTFGLSWSTEFNEIEPSRNFIKVYSEEGAPKTNHSAMMFDYRNSFISDEVSGVTGMTRRYSPVVAIINESNTHNNGIYLGEYSLYRFSSKRVGMPTPVRTSEFVLGGFGSSYSDKDKHNGSWMRMPSMPFPGGGTASTSVPYVANALGMPGADDVDGLKKLTELVMGVPRVIDQSLGADVARSLLFKFSYMSNLALESGIRVNIGTIEDDGTDTINAQYDATRGLIKYSPRNHREVLRIYNEVQEKLANNENVDEEMRKLSTILGMYGHEMTHLVTHNKVKRAMKSLLDLFGSTEDGKAANTVDELWQMMLESDAVTINNLMAKKFGLKWREDAALSYVVHMVNVAYSVKSALESDVKMSDDLRKKLEYATSSIYELAPTLLFDDHSRNWAMSTQHTGFLKGIIEKLVGLLRNIFNVPGNMKKLGVPSIHDELIYSLTSLATNKIDMMISDNTRIGKDKVVHFKKTC